MMSHPEQRDGETYLGNVVTADHPAPHLATLKTSRLGSVAYDVDGKKLPDTYGLSPLFISSSERDLYSAIKRLALEAAAGRYRATQGA